MKRLLVIPLLFLAAAVVLAGDFDDIRDKIKGEITPAFTSKLKKPEQPNPDYHARLAAEFLDDSNRSVDNKYKPDIRFLSFYHMWKNKEILTERLKVTDFWINNLHFEVDCEHLREVPGSDGLLYWFFLSDFGWNRDAFSAVARREFFFREPSVNSGPANFLRQVIGVDQDPNTLHCEAIIRGDWFFRETVETDRSPAYYDLLFAKQRFTGGTEKITKEVDETFYFPGGLDSTGKFFAAGNYVRKVKKEEVVKKAKFVKFPANEKDFEKAFGVDKTFDFIRETGINLKHGAVVEGAEKGVSAVARQNRLIERTFGPVGHYYKTFDVKETSGKRDFVEQLNKDFEFDAGEILARLPAGGQAGLLVDAKGNIVETADNRFATDKSDIVFDARVRTYGSCVVCHEQAIIKPQNIIEQMLKAGVDIKFKDPKDARDARAFFLHWEEELISDQNRYSVFLAKTSGFKPGENAQKFKQYRDWYDSEVGLEEAALETGLPVDVFKYVASKSTKARVLNLIQGITMPRKTWDVDGYREVMLQLDALRTTK